MKLINIHNKVPNMNSSNNNMTNDELEYSKINSKLRAKLIEFSQTNQLNVQNAEKVLIKLKENVKNSKKINENLIDQLILINTKLEKEMQKRDKQNKSIAIENERKALSYRMYLLARKTLKLFRDSIYLIKKKKKINHKSENAIQIITIKMAQRITLSNKTMKNKIK